MPTKFNSNSLKEARRSRKLSIADVSHFTRISEGSIRKFEEDEKLPSVIQVEKLAALYNSSLFTFFSEGRFEAPDSLTDFRKANLGSANVSPKGLMKIWSAENSGTFLADLLSALGRNRPKTKSFARITNLKKPDSSELRTAFDDWSASHTQTLKIQGSDEERFIKLFRYFLEIHGCRTIFNSAPLEDFLGFFTDNQRRVETIFVNREIGNLKRKVFTFAHEAAHMIYDLEGISDPFVATNTIEKKCNRFAGDFLAPEVEILRLIDKLPRATLVDPIRLISAVSKATLLSRQAAALRLKDLDVISASQTRNFFAHLSTLRGVGLVSVCTR